MLKISAKLDYACRALLELSLHWPNPLPLQVNEIARRQKIPTKFLVHILIMLKQFGLVESLRGQKGGYVLSRAPKDISLYTLFEIFSEKKLKVSQFYKSDMGLINQICQEGESVMGDYFKHINFETMRLRYRSQEKVPLYSI